ncbi:MAG: tetratricopeptide repeat protein, partial [Deltaproteobacteria bacterium]
GGTDDAAGPLPIDPALVERDEATRTISECIDRFIATRKGGVVAITAPRGHGTTRLLRFAAERLLATENVRLLTTTVREADGAYAPVTRLLWERFGITPAKGPETARSEIVAEVTRVLGVRGLPSGEHARRIVLAAGLQPDGGTSGRWEVEAGRGMPRMVESVSRFLQADAEQLPIAIVVDHLEAAPDEGFAVFQAVVTLLMKAPVLVVVAGEPSLNDRLGALPRTSVQARALSSDGSAALVRSLLPGLSEVPSDLLDAVVRRANGAPGKIREILLALVESRVVLVDEAPWRVDLDALDGTGPVSTADVIAFRLKRLDPEARGMLERAAVVGEVFWEGAVAAILRVEQGDPDPFGEDPAAPRVADALRRLAGAELIAPIEESELVLEREYAFAIPGLRTLVLRDLDPQTLRARHDVIASWLELAAGGRSDDLARAIAGHLEKAGLHAPAARAYLRAARAARASYRGPQAVQLFDRALSLLNPGDAPTRIDALHDRGVVLSLVGRMDDAEQTFTDMYVLARRYGTRNKMAAALGRLGRVARSRGDFDAARAYLSGALTLFQHAEDSRGIAGVEDDLGILCYIAGDFERAIEHSTRALNIRRELEDPLGEALSTHSLGLVHFARGQPRQARAHFERALALREKHGDLEGTVATRNVLAAIAYDRGEVDVAVGMWHEILELAEALGDKRMILVATVNLGEAAVRRGDVTLATQL